MIERYRDHAANERTYLAWVRTALAFMGFGLLVERFDLFLTALAGSGRDATASPDPLLPPAAAGAALVLLGVVALAISSYRYVRFKRLIDAAETVEFRASRTDGLLVVIVSAIAAFMLVYVIAQHA